MNRLDILPDHTIDEPEGYLVVNVTPKRVKLLDLTMDTIIDWWMDDDGIRVAVHTVQFDRDVGINSAPTPAPITLVPPPIEVVHWLNGRRDASRVARKGATTRVRDAGQILRPKETP